LLALFSNFEFFDVDLDDRKEDVGNYGATPPMEVLFNGAKQDPWLGPG
jgi:hypothetical protein